MNINIIKYFYILVMKNIIKKFIKVTPIYVVLIINNRFIRWEIFKDYQLLNDVKKLLEIKYNITEFTMEIYNEHIINYFYKIKSYIPKKNKNGLDIHIYTNSNIIIPKDD